MLKAVQPVKAGAVTLGGRDLVLIAGPCVIESRDATLQAAERLAQITRRLNIPFIFKSSYDKANRTSLSSYRGPGLDAGLQILREVRESFRLPVLTDVHSVPEAKTAAEVVDVLQIPAFLCRQTDLLIAAAETGRPVNVKKGQFLSPWEVEHLVEKVRRSGSGNVSVTERGSSFGYNNLVVDMRSVPIVRSFGVPVVFDGTHSVQLPGGGGGRSGGQREFVPVLARAAVAAGCDAVFLEVHEDPDHAPCDGPNMLPIDDVEFLWKQLRNIRAALVEDRETT